MHTKQIYLEQPDLHAIEASIVDIGNDERGDYFICNQTIFYPQGGGQPADHGDFIGGNASIFIHDVRFVDGLVRHYASACRGVMSVGQAITMHLNGQRRVLNTRYHSAGHLVAAVVESLSATLQATKGHQFPGEAYVQFAGSLHDKDSFLVSLQDEVNKAIQADSSVVTGQCVGKEGVSSAMPSDKIQRQCHIDGFSPVPCGGTHVGRLGELGQVVIKGAKNKKGQLKIAYQLADA